MRLVDGVRCWRQLGISDEGCGREQLTLPAYWKLQQQWQQQRQDRPLVAVHTSCLGH